MSASEDWFSKAAAAKPTLVKRNEVGFERVLEPHVDAAILRASHGLKGPTIQLRG